MSVEAAATKESCYNKIRQSIKLNAKIQKLIKNKKKIVQNMKTRMLIKSPQKKLKIATFLIVFTRLLFSFLET